MHILPTKTFTSTIPNYWNKRIRAKWKKEENNTDIIFLYYWITSKNHHPPKTFLNAKIWHFFKQKALKKKLRWQRKQKGCVISFSSSKVVHKRNLFYTWKNRKIWIFSTHQKKGKEFFQKKESIERKQPWGESYPMERNFQKKSRSKFKKSTSRLVQKSAFLPTLPIKIQKFKVVGDFEGAMLTQKTLY